MQTELLRELLDEALNEPNEKSRVDSFWVYAPAYDECIPLFRKIFNSKNMRAIGSEECKVTRIKEGFFIEDCHGGRMSIPMRKCASLSIYGKKVC